MYLAVIAAAMMVACNGKKTAQNETKNDSVCVADSVRPSSPLPLTAPISSSRTTSTARTDTTRQAACCRYSTAT